MGRRSDVYSLGAILYHLLTGRPPFVGETLTDTLRRTCEHGTGLAAPAQSQRARDLETLCLKCLEKEPLRRYSSAAVLAGDLDRFLNQQPILARPANPLRKLWGLSKSPAVAVHCAGRSLRSGSHGDGLLAME